jgi:hypothetical protein
MPNRPVCSRHVKPSDDNEELLFRIEELEARQQEAAKKIWNLEQTKLRLESQLAQGIFDIFSFIHITMATGSPIQ